MQYEEELAGTQFISHRFRIFIQYNKLKSRGVMMTIQHVCRNGNDDIREDRDKKNWHEPS